jgi:hypothetical protein
MVSDSINDAIQWFGGTRNSTVCKLGLTLLRFPLEIPGFYLRSEVGGPGGVGAPKLAAKLFRLLGISFS